MTPPVGVQIVDGVLPNCKAIIEHLEKADAWRPSTVAGTQPVDEKIRTSVTTFVPMLSWHNDPIIHEMNRAVWQLLDKYAQEYNFGFTNVEDVSIQRYEIGDFYKPHHDHGTNQPRIVSAVAYLNTVEVGGGTRFTRFDYTVEPIAGRIAIFPANYVYEHEALAPVSGVKIAAAYWAQG